MGGSARAGEAEDLARVLHKWQAMFRMADWKISVGLVPREMLPCAQECVAASSFDVGSRRGSILVLRRADYTPEIRRHFAVKNVPRDQRDSIVHELLHCVLDNMYPEAAVQVLSRALKP